MIRRLGKRRRGLLDEGVDFVIRNQNLRDKDILGLCDFTVIRRQDLFYALGRDIERHRLAVDVRHRRWDARDDGGALTAVRFAIVLHAVLTDKT